MRLIRIMTALLAILVVVSACSTDTTPEETTVLLCSEADSADNVDADGDGYTPCQGDCDDNDPNASPG